MKPFGVLFAHTGFCEKSDEEIRAVFEFGRHGWFALWRLITKFEMLHIPRFVTFLFHEISRVKETPADEINIWKATPQDNVFL